MLRQLGWHASAARCDGRAAAIALPVLSGTAPGGTGFLAAGRSSPAREDSSTVLDDATGSLSSQTSGGSGVGLPNAGTAGPDAVVAAADAFPGYALPGMVDAACDALTGLAADALGTGRVELAVRLLGRSRRLLDDGRDRRRLWVRWLWVSAETALARGDAVSAVSAAEAALVAAEEGPSVRHRVKSRLLVAAAALAVGDVNRAGGSAEAVAVESAENDLLPLRWACAMLRAGLPGADSAEAENEIVECVTAITRRGGCFSAHGSP